MLNCIHCHDYYYIACHPNDYIYFSGDVQFIFIDGSLAIFGFAEAVAACYPRIEASFYHCDIERYVIHSIIRYHFALRERQLEVVNVIWNI